MEFQIIRADVKDAEAIAGVIREAYEQMEHKEWYFPDDAEYMRDLLSPRLSDDVMYGNPAEHKGAAFVCRGEDPSAVYPGCGLKGIALKAVEISSGRLAGIFTAAFPGDTSKSMGWDIGFTAEQCRWLAHMDTAAVLPEYRGCHLQYRMMQEAERELRAMGFRYLAATVHPENHASRNTMLLQGYQVRITKEKYSGYLRDVMLKVL